MTMTLDDWVEAVWKAAHERPSTRIKKILEDLVSNATENERAQCAKIAEDAGDEFNDTPTPADYACQKVAERIRKSSGSTAQKP